ncbi:hypothetical protein QOT17_000686 [Balamuthia mandrillaris]
MRRQLAVLLLCWALSLVSVTKGAQQISVGYCEGCADPAEFYAVTVEEGAVVTVVGNVSLNNWFFMVSTSVTIRATHPDVFHDAYIKITSGTYVEVVIEDISLYGNNHPAVEWSDVVNGSLTIRNARVKGRGSPCLVVYAGSGENHVGLVTEDVVFQDVLSSVLATLLWGTVLIGDAQWVSKGSTVITQADTSSTLISVIESVWISEGPLRFENINSTESLVFLINGTWIASHELSFLGININPPLTPILCEEQNAHNHLMISPCDSTVQSNCTCPGQGEDGARPVASVEVMEASEDDLPSALWLLSPFQTLKLLVRLSFPPSSSSLPLNLSLAITNLNGNGEEESSWEVYPAQATFTEEGQVNARLTAWTVAFPSSSSVFALDLLPSPSVFLASSAYRVEVVVPSTPGLVVPGSNMVVRFATKTSFDEEEGEVVSQFFPDPTLILLDDNDEESRAPTPMEELALSAQFLRLSEVLSDEEVLQTYSLQDQNFSVVHSNVESSHLPSIVFSADLVSNSASSVATQARLSLNFTLFAEGTELEFGGTNFYVEPQTCKWSLLLEDWPWLSSSSHLELELSVVSKDGPYLLATKEEEEGGGKMTSFTLYTNGTNIPLNFLKVAMVDEVVEEEGAVQVEWKPENETFVLRFMARFQQTLRYDPDLSVLLGGASGEDGADGEKEEDDDDGDELWWKIVVPVVLVVTVVAVVGLLVGVWVWRKRKAEEPSLETPSSVNF